MLTRWHSRPCSGNTTLFILAVYFGFWGLCTSCFRKRRAGLLRRPRGSLTARRTNARRRKRKQMPQIISNSSFLFIKPPTYSSDFVSCIQTKTHELCQDFDHHWTAFHAIKHFCTQNGRVNVDLAGSPRFGWKVIHFISLHTRGPEEYFSTSPPPYHV